MKRGGYSLIFLLSLIAVVAALCAVLFPTVAGPASLAIWCLRSSAGCRY